MNIIEPESVNSDSRRTLIQLITAKIRQVNLVRADKGAILGNHYHKETTEYFLITKGTVLFNDVVVFNKGTSFVVYPDENHTIKCLTKVEYISLLSRPFTKASPDIYKYET